MSHEWYSVSNIGEIDSPALIVYKDRVLANIRTLVNSIDHVSRLRPHIKTHKSSEVSKMLLENGIQKFKCATIAEAEMLASAGAKDILLAYQPVGPKAKRFLELKKSFPRIDFSCLIDNISSAGELASLVAKGHTADFFIDLNVGMNRTGISPEDAFELWQECLSFPTLIFRGLHAYDGHIRDMDFSLRKKRSNDAFDRVKELATKIEEASKKKVTIVAGGTPTYSIHSQRQDIECSPGTFIYWDKGYEHILQEQHYLHAAVVVTRIISKPAEGIICVDLGHKSIASENPLSQRVFFLNAPDLQPIGHSEEHMVLKTEDDKKYRIGDVLYGVPYHVCPTIALYERDAVAESGKVNEYWTTLSRNKRITI